MKLVGYINSDWGGLPDDMKSTTRYIFSLGISVISWNSRKQEVVAQSTAKAEYIAATTTVTQAIWLRKVLKDLNLEEEQPIVIYCDNNSVVAMAKNFVFHKRTKHMKIKFHFLREAEQ